MAELAPSSIWLWQWRLWRHGSRDQSEHRRINSLWLIDTTRCTNNNSHIFTDHLAAEKTQ